MFASRVVKMLPGANDPMTENGDVELVTIAVDGTASAVNENTVPADGVVDHLRKMPYATATGVPIVIVTFEL
jgi:hypothetical protein